LTVNWLIVHRIALRTDLRALEAARDRAAQGRSRCVRQRTSIVQAGSKFPIDRRNDVLQTIAVILVVRDWRRTPAPWNQTEVDMVFEARKRTL
jgi:hypothetical protein